MHFARTSLGPKREETEDRKENECSQSHGESKSGTEEARADGRNDLVDRRLLAALLCCELKRAAAAGDSVAAGRAPLRCRVYGRRLCVSS